MVYTVRVIEVIESAACKRGMRDLRDRAAVARINARLRNVSPGNFSDSKELKHASTSL